LPRGLPRGPTLPLTEPAWVRLLDRLNPLVVAILRSPVHWLASSGLMAITITGRRSGRSYTIPVGYHDVGDAVVVLVSDGPGRSWWRNFRAPHPALLTIRGREVPARGLALDAASDEFGDRAEQAFRRAGFIPRIFGVDFDAEQGLTAEQQSQLGKTAAIVRFVPDPSPPESG
jgi:hypothetical protein